MATFIAPNLSPSPYLFHSLICPLVLLSIHFLLLTYQTKLDIQVIDIQHIKPVEKSRSRSRSRLTPARLLHQLHLGPASLGLSRDAVSLLGLHLQDRQIVPALQRPPSKSNTKVTNDGEKD